MKSGRITDWLFATAVAGAGIAFFLAIYRPQLRSIDAIQRRIVNTRGEISRSESFMRGLEDLERYLRDFQESLAGLDRLVPAKTDADERFREIIAVADRCGLHDTNVRPDPALPFGSVVVHPLVVKVTGTFGEVQKFLFESEALQRHTRVTRFLVQHQEPATPGAPQTAAVNAEIEITSYSIVAEGGGAS